MPTPRSRVIYFEKQFVRFVSYDACPEFFDPFSPKTSSFTRTVEDNLFKNQVLNHFSGLKRQLIELLFEDHNIHTAAATLGISNSKAYKLRDELRDELPALLQR